MSTREFSELEKRVTLWGVAIVFLLSALDQTIVATAMPRIIAELNGLALYSWVTTAYLLASTVMVPIWGKLGDLFGRKPVLLAGITIFLTGSWLSGLSRSEEHTSELQSLRSEERRVGKECRSRWSPYH